LRPPVSAKDGGVGCEGFAFEDHEGLESRAGPAAALGTPASLQALTFGRLNIRLLFPLEKSSRCIRRFLPAHFRKRAKYQNAELKDIRPSTAPSTIDKWKRPKPTRRDARLDIYVANPRARFARLAYTSRAGNASRHDTIDW